VEVEEDRSTIILMLRKGIGCSSGERESRRTGRADGSKGRECQASFVDRQGPEG
jgi:hypothetical protein